MDIPKGICAVSGESSKDFYAGTRKVYLPEVAGDVGKKVRTNFPTSPGCRIARFIRASFPNVCVILYGMTIAVVIAKVVTSAFQTDRKSTPRDQMYANLSAASRRYRGVILMTRAFLRSIACFERVHR